MHPFPPKISSNEPTAGAAATVVAAQRHRNSQGSGDPSKDSAAPEPAPGALDVTKLQSAIDRAMSLHDFTLSEAGRDHFENSQIIKNLGEKNVIVGELGGGDRRVKGFHERVSHGFEKEGMSSKPSPFRAQLANIITESNENVDGSDLFEQDSGNQIDDGVMGKISEKLNLDFKKFKSMTKESQKDVQQVILDYRLQMTQENQKSQHSISNSSVKSQQKYLIQSDSRHKNRSPSSTADFINAFRSTQKSRILKMADKNRNSNQSLTNDFLKIIEQENYKKELQKRIFRVLLRDYDDDTMEFTNPEHERAVPARNSQGRDSQHARQVRRQQTVLEVGFEDDMQVQRKVAAFMKKFEKPDKVKEVKVTDHSNPHVLQVIRTLGKPREDRQTQDLKLLEEEIEGIGFFQDIDIGGKYLFDVCERLEYLYVEQGDEVVSHDYVYDKCFILVDGTLEFQIDLLDPYFQDRHLMKIAHDISLPPMALIKEVNQYRKQNRLTYTYVFKGQVQNMVETRIHRIFSYNYRGSKHQFDEDGVDDFFERSTKVKSAEPFSSSIYGSAPRQNNLKEGQFQQLPIIHDFEMQERSEIASSGGREPGDCEVQIDDLSPKEVSENKKTNKSGVNNHQIDDYDTQKTSQIQKSNRFLKGKMQRKQQNNNSTLENEASDFLKNQSPVRLKYGGGRKERYGQKKGGSGVRKSEESVLATEPDHIQKTVDIDRTCEQNQTENVEMCQSSDIGCSKDHQNSSLQQMTKEQEDDASNYKHLYSLATVTRKGGKFRVEEQDVLSQFDTETKKFKNRILNSGEEFQSPAKGQSKKERVNPPYIFGIGFARPDKKSLQDQKHQESSEHHHVHSKYTAICKTDCHFMVISKKHLTTIHDRILKKQQKEEILIMKRLKQLSGCTNKILTKLQQCRRVMTVLRNQYLFKEGEEAENLYIVKQGQFVITKAIKEKRVQNVEHDLLLKHTTTTQRYNTMLKQRQALRKCFEVRIRQYDGNAMFGDQECILNLQYQTSVMCVDQQATVFVISKKDFQKIKTDSEEQWKEIVRNSEDNAQDIIKTYLTQLVKTETLKCQGAMDEKGDIKTMCLNLMKEMHWQKPPQTIEMYTIKKHMQDIPHLKNKSVTQMSRTDYENISKSEWAKRIRGQRPATSMNQKKSCNEENAIYSYKQIRKKFDEQMTQQSKPVKKYAHKRTINFSVDLNAPSMKKRGSNDRQIDHQFLKASSQIAASQDLGHPNSIQKNSVFDSRDSISSSNVIKQQAYFKKPGHHRVHRSIHDFDSAKLLSGEEAIIADAMATSNAARYHLDLMRKSQAPTETSSIPNFNHRGSYQGFQVTQSKQNINYKASNYINASKGPNGPLAQQSDLKNIQVWPHNNLKPYQNIDHQQVQKRYAQCQNDYNNYSGGKDNRFNMRQNSTSCTTTVPPTLAGNTIISGLSRDDNLTMHGGTFDFKQNNQNGKTKENQPHGETPISSYIHQTPSWNPNTSTNIPNMHPSNKPFRLNKQNLTLGVSQVNRQPKQMW